MTFMVCFIAISLFTCNLLQTKCKQANPLNFRCNYYNIQKLCKGKDKLPFKMPGILHPTFSNYMDYNTDYCQVIEVCNKDLLKG